MLLTDNVVYLVTKNTCKTTETTHGNLHNIGSSSFSSINHDMHRVCRKHSTRRVSIGDYYHQPRLTSSTTVAVKSITFLHQCKKSMRDELTKTPLLILSSFKPILQSVNNDNDKGKTTASSPSPQPVHLQAVNKATQSSLTDHLLPPHQCQDLFGTKLIHPKSRRGHARCQHHSHHRYRQCFHQPTGQDSPSLTNLLVPPHKCQHLFESNLRHSNHRCRHIHCFHRSHCHCIEPQRRQCFHIGAGERREKRRGKRRRIDSGFHAMCHRTPTYNSIVHKNLKSTCGPQGCRQVSGDTHVSAIPPLNNVAALHAYQRLHATRMLHC